MHFTLKSTKQITIVIPTSICVNRRNAVLLCFYTYEI